MSMRTRHSGSTFNGINDKELVLGLHRPPVQDGENAVEG